MSETNQCPECGAVLPASAPRGLCPACLLKRGLETNTVGLTEEAGRAGGGGGVTRWTPPGVEEIAARFPDLEILRLIGRGGMGAVYQARQKNLDRMVALKILPPEIGQDPAFTERFAREAQAMARLNHPHIVAIYDFGQRGEEGGREGRRGLFFFIMEYVDGLSLRGLLDAGHMAPKEALAIVPQICEALQYAHDQGIVHRDIKPENILLNKAGQVKIADFGLAKLMGRTEGKGLRTESGERAASSQLSPQSSVLIASQVAGTPQYMAPEQMERPAEVDHRADIYSLGVVFYQMLTGELPVGRFAPPSRKVQIDVRLDEVVLRAMEKEPEKRYQNVSEVKTCVETIITTPQPPAARLQPEMAQDPATFHSPVPSRRAAKVPPFRLIMLPTFSIPLALSLLFAGEGFPWREADSIWLLWLGIMTSIAAVLFTLFWFAARSRHVFVRISAAMTFLIIALLGGYIVLKGGDPLSTIPFALHACFGLVYLVWLILLLLSDMAAPPSAAAAPIALPLGPDPAILDRARAAVRGPAIGLLVTGIFNWVLMPPILIVVALLVARASMVQRNYPLELGLSGAPVPSPTAVFVGHTNAIVWKELLIAVPLLILLLSSLMIFAALRMKRLQSYPSAVVASVLAMIISPGNMIGLPLGIWSLVVLSRREVREAFRAVRGGARARRGGSDQAPPRGSSSGLILTLASHVAVLICLFIFCVGVVPRFTMVFRDFSVALPFITRVTFAVSQLVVRWWFFAIPVAALFLVADAGVYRLLDRAGQKMLRRAWSLLVLFALGTVFAVGVSSLPAAMSKLINTVDEPHTVWNQTEINDLQPGGTIRYELTSDTGNLTNSTWSTYQFVNSDFVHLDKITMQGQPVQYITQHDEAARLFRYTVALPAPVPPGQVFTMVSEGAAETLVNPTGEPGVFEYKMKHWPAIDGDTRRVEVHRLPAGATLLEKSPSDLAQSEKDGRIELRIDRIIPPGGNMEIRYRYRLAPEAALAGSPIRTWVAGGGWTPAEGEIIRGRAEAADLRGSLTGVLDREATATRVSDGANRPVPPMWTPGGENDLAPPPDGSLPKSNFYGTGGSAMRIVYVLDHSASLRSHFKALQQEAKRSINNLLPVQTFGLIVFAGPAQGAEVLTPGMNLVHASGEEKQAACSKLDHVVATGSNGDEFDLYYDALQKAFAMKPQLIYFLTDCRFDPRLTEAVRNLNARNKPKIVINSIAFVGKDDGYFDQMKQLSTDSGGKFKFISERDAEGIDSLPAEPQPATAPAASQPALHIDLEFQTETMQNIVSMILQRYPIRLAFENLDFDMAKDPITLTQALRQFEAGEKAGALSPNEKQRLEIARKMVKDGTPGTMLFDVGPRYTAHIKASSAEDLLTQLTRQTPYAWRKVGSTYLILPAAGTVLNYPVTLKTAGLTVAQATQKVAEQSPAGQSIVSMSIDMGPSPKPGVDSVPWRSASAPALSLVNAPAIDALTKITEQARPASVWELSGYHGQRNLGLSPAPSPPFNSTLKLDLWHTINSEHAVIERFGRTPAEHPLAVPNTDDWGVMPAEYPADMAAIAAEIDRQHIPGLSWGANPTVADLGALKNLKNLRTLNLWGVQISYAELVPLRELTGLHTLVVSGPKITDAGLANLKTMAELRALHLQRTGITGTGLSELKGLKNLEILDLGGTPLTDADMATLRELKNLRTLVLRETKVTDAGLAHLKDLTSLQSLNLGFTKVTDAGLKDLKVLKSLRSLWLSSPVSNSAVAELQKSLPDCHIDLWDPPIDNR